MTQSQVQQAQQVSTQRRVPASGFVASVNSLRNAAFALLADRALSA